MLKLNLISYIFKFHWYLYRSDSSSGRRSPHSKDIIKISNGNTSHGNSSNRMLMLVNYFIRLGCTSLNIILCVTLGM